MSRSHERVWRCDCDICVRFRSAVAFWSRGPCGFCGICHREDLRLADYVPPLLREFLGVDAICYSCAGVINGYVADSINHGGWRLCWQADSDDALKWAMVDWVRSSVWFHHWYGNKWHGAGKYPPVGLTAQRGNTR